MQCRHGPPLGQVRSTMPAQIRPSSTSDPTSAGGPCGFPELSPTVPPSDPRLSAAVPSFPGSCAVASWGVSHEQEGGRRLSLRSGNITMTSWGAPSCLFLMDRVQIRVAKVRVLLEKVYPSLQKDTAPSQRPMLALLYSVVQLPKGHAWRCNLLLDRLRVADHGQRTSGACHGHCNRRINIMRARPSRRQTHRSAGASRPGSRPLPACCSAQG